MYRNVKVIGDAVGRGCIDGYIILAIYFDRIDARGNGYPHDFATYEANVWDADAASNNFGVVDTEVIADKEEGGTGTIADG